MASAEEATRTPVLAVACEPFPSLRHLPLRDDYPTLNHFYSHALPRFDSQSYYDTRAATLEYKINGVTFEAADDETWSVLLTLIKTNRVSLVSVRGVVWGGRRRGASAGKTEKQVLHDWEVAVKLGGQAQAWDQLPDSRRANYMRMLELMDYLVGSSDYVVNPLYVVCPLCGKWTSMGRLCNRTLYDLCGRNRHLERHLTDPRLSPAASYLLSRYQNYMKDLREPLDPGFTSTIPPPPVRQGSAFLQLSDLQLSDNRGNTICNA
jgi:hypothetical protein